MNRSHTATIAEWLDERDRAILANLDKFRLLSTRHVQQLHFADRSSELAAARAATRTMQRLNDLGVVTALARRIGGARKGSAGYVWQLASSGERFVRSVRGHARRRRYVEPGSVFVNHTLAVNDLAVDLLVASRDLPRFVVEELGTEPENWRTYLGAGGEVRWLKPDLHVISSITDEAEIEYEDHTFLELDLGTEHLPRIQAKCRRYLAYAETGAYQAAHGLFPAVVWLSPDPARRTALEAAVRATSGLPGGVFRVAGPEDYLARATGRG
ncbi:replication-relaxation family protein [Nocardioides pyridinolyticus]